MLVHERGQVVAYPEALDLGVSEWGPYAWPKRLPDAYCEERGYEEDRRVNGVFTPPRPKPEFVPNEQKPLQFKPVEPGMTHVAHFVQSLRNGAPGVETAEEGFYAAAAGRLATTAYRMGRKAEWNYKTGKVTLV